jgi:drug/metabolite transporter (DMT)-like permease
MAAITSDMPADTTPLTAPRAAPMAGIALYLGALVAFSAMDAATKTLVAGLPVVQVMWGRFTFHLVTIALALLVWQRAGRRARGMALPFAARAPGLQVVRSLSLAACNLLFAAALVHVPLAQATTINFVGPVITICLAALWLGERVGWRKWCGVALGLAGVLVVIRPGMGPGGLGIHPAGLFALGATTCFAVYQLLTRKLAGVDRAETTIFQTGLWATLATTAVVAFVWVSPGLRGWGLMALLGALGAVGHYLLVLAYDRAPASLLAPMAYAQMIAATLWGMLLFGEEPDGWTIGGAAIIAAGGLVVISAEAGRRQNSGDAAAGGQAVKEA